MINIVDKKNCCGCSACASVCPKNCISMQPDSEGFLYPVVDESACIECGLCENVCNELHPYHQRQPLKVLAAINKDETIRMKSSSGGIFHILAGSIIKEGGVVFGARFDENWQVVTDFAGDMKGVEAFMGSKYVQSRVGNAYNDVKKFLEEGRKVLFSGTPCQVAGLHKFLRKPFDNLLTVDFVCHGTPSPKVWERYLDTTVKHGKRISRVDFRNKETGWSNYSFSIRYDDSELTAPLISPHPQNPYMNAFLKEIILRPSCYDCKAKGCSSQSDITIADFWGINTVFPDMDDDKGTGMIFVNTKKGQTSIDFSQMEIRETTYERIKPLNPSCHSSVQPHPRRGEFFSRLDGENLIDLIEDCTKPPMKIGILTLPLHTNYGGILQAYALQTVLERMGYSVEVIDKRWETIPWNRWNRMIFHIKSGLRKLVNKPYCLDYRHPSVYPHVSINTRVFIEKYIRQRHIEDWSELNESDYDVIVVGSDQIWRPIYVPYLMDSRPENAFLDFAAGWAVKRISYAPSFGTTDWEYSDEASLACSELLKKFDAVSVRESSGVDLVNRHFGVRAEHVLDPTLLLSREDYIQLCASTPKSKGNFLTYILDSNDQITAFIDSIAERNNLTAFTVNSKVENPWAPLKDRIQPSVEQWLRGFYDAELIITDSFHACVFSLIFNKPFIVIGNKERGLARFESFLSMFHQQERLISSLSDTPLEHLIRTAPDVDLSVLRKKSMDYLQKALSNE